MLKYTYINYYELTEKLLSMIKVSGLNKTYRSRRGKCKALVDIDLCLPDNGLVFVLGKSGSGKSTLLNLIGGLDSITKGSISVDGNEVSSFTEKEFTKYRNNHIGFIFQDYHLIEEMTVYENVALSLDLRNMKDDRAVDEALEMVGLGGYQKRYPSELSGGEQQRVAIARALVKKPHIILADEPTGNLDHQTATVIIGILKELAKNCLILIVSHNRDDAYLHADRIIELSRGRIIADYVKNKNYSEEISLDGDTLHYPMDRLLTDGDVEIINNNLKCNSIKKVIRRTDKFTPYENNVREERAIPIENHTLSFKDLSRLSLRFLKNKLGRIAISAIISSAIMICLALAQTIVFFDPNRVISNYMKSSDLESVIVMKEPLPEVKSILPFECHAAVGKDDLASFANAGYTGNIYPILSYTVPISTSGNSAGYKRSYFSNSIYICESLGTLVVNEDFLTKKFGEISYLAKAETESPIGVIITDYIADCILTNTKNYSGKTYDDLVGNYYYTSPNFRRVYINGIIDTDYKTEHKEFIDKYNSKAFPDIFALHEDMGFLNFTNSVFDSLGFCFSLNPSFREDFVGNNEVDLLWHHKLVFDGKHEYITSSSPYISQDQTGALGLGEGEVIMNYSRYNSIFGTSYNSSNLKDFVPHTVTVSQYHFDDLLNENPIMQTEFKIVALTQATTYGLMITDPTVYSTFSETSIYELGLYFDSTENVSSVLDIASSLHYEQQILAIEGIHTMTKAVSIFVPIFDIVNKVLCFAIVFILMNFSMKMIKDKMHDIGILKALGMKNIDLGGVFGLQIGLIALLTSTASIFGYSILVGFANKILFVSLQALATGHFVMDLEFLTFTPKIALLDIGIIIVLSAISLVIPLLKIRNIKPVQIIRSKD
jgi:ABC-type lipoprotein export system ATPase subunit